MVQQFKEMMKVHASQPILLDEEFEEVVGAGDCQVTCQVSCGNSCDNSCGHTQFTITTKDKPELGR